MTATDSTKQAETSSSAEITFDIVISGCATTCWHCYVCGGPAPPMAMGDYDHVLAFVDQFRRVANGEGIQVYPYLDLEPMLHPEIARILSLAQTVEGFDIPTCVPTTGLPLARRDDWEQVLAAYREAGVQQLELTLHGPESIHDWAVSREGAYRSHLQAAQRAKEKGFEVRLNLMVSKPMLRRFRDTMEAVDAIGYDHRRAAIPHYEPNERLRRFERFRPELPDVLPHLEALRELCDDKARDGKLWMNAAESTEAKAYEDLLTDPRKYASYQRLIHSLPTWHFVTVGPDLDIWYGNGFDRTEKLGRVGETPPTEVLEGVLGRYPNYAFGVTVPIEALPSPLEVAKEVADPRGKRIYHRLDEIHVMWLDHYLTESTDR